jgi:arginase
MLLLPWHLYTALPSGLNVTLPPGTTQLDGRFGTTGAPWQDLVGVYAPLADAVAQDTGQTVVLSGDCVASLAVLSGVQRRGIRPSLVWFDAHGDFHTEASTTSGYPGGLPLAKAVGRGDLTLPDALGLVPLDEESVTLVDARNLDPAEVEALDASNVAHVLVGGLDTGRLPDGRVVVHVDVDVDDPSELSGLRFPAAGGPSLRDLADAVQAVIRDRPLVALDISASWRPEDTMRAQTDAVLSALLSTVRTPR